MSENGKEKFTRFRDKINGNMFNYFGTKTKTIN